MSVHISEPLVQAILPGGILIASLLGSAHCVGMCGGLVVSFTKDAKGVALYHLGRLASYTFLGALAGALGGAAFKTPFAKQAPWIASVFFGIVLIFVGVRRLTGKTLHVALPKVLARVSSKLISRVLKHTDTRSGVLLLGFLSALLPCGWLYTFVLAASATKSAALGAVSLALFWLGTVPALSIAPLAFNKMTARMRQTTPKLSGVVLIALGLFALTMHASTLFSVSHEAHAEQPNAQECPFHH